MDENTTNIDTKQAVNITSSMKPFYQFFTGYILAIFLVVTMTFSVAGVFLFQQMKQTQTLIVEQFIPQQTQLLQQTYLINTDKLLDNMLQNSNVHELVVLQQQLLLQSKKLLLLQSEYQQDYQQWFSSNTLTSQIVTRIEASDSNNDALKHKALKQLETLLGAIKTQMAPLESNALISAYDKQQKIVVPITLLSTVEKQLHAVFILLEGLTLHMPLSNFEQLRHRISAIFVAKYPKQFSEQKLYNEVTGDIVRELIHFEDIILVGGVIDKWHEQLRLMTDYQQHLWQQKQRLQSILYRLSKDDYGIDTQSNGYIKANQNILNASKLPQWLMVTLVVAFVSFLILLWLIKKRIKLISKEVFTVVEDALASEQKNLSNHNQSFYSTETEQLADKIQQRQCAHNNKGAFEVLEEKNKELAAKVLQDKSIQAKLQRDLTSLEFAMSSQAKATILVEQQRSSVLYLSTLKQLVLLGKSAQQLTKSTDTSNSINNHLYQAHLQGQEVVNTLRQASCYRYLQSDDAVLRLAKVSFVNQIQTTSLNLHGELLRYNNSLSVTIDEKILNNVTLDKALFSELLNAFIKLLLTEQNDKKLSLNLLLVDHNHHQQRILFSGEIADANHVLPLPSALNVFYDNSSEHNEHSTYFASLVRFLQGHDINVTLTDQSYQLSFTLALAIINNDKPPCYPTLLLPNYLTEIKNTGLQLTNKYLPRPIEVLMAVKQPIQYQRLQQILHSIGLQVTFVTDAAMLEKNWQSGRFTILMTAIACQPFTEFMTDTTVELSSKEKLIRGVFDLIKTADSRNKPPAYQYWIVGELTAQSNENDIITAMHPWLQTVKPTTQAIETDVVVSTNIHLESKVETKTETKVAQQHALVSDHPVSFNIERYIKHQGSAELAIFMLGEYTAENIALVQQLSQAFINDDAIKASVAVQSLFVNSKILAADYLVHLCQHWQKLLKNKMLDKHNKVQISLLKKTKKAVASISKHADVIT